MGGMMSPKNPKTIDEAIANKKKGKYKPPPEDSGMSRVAPRSWSIDAPSPLTSPCSGATSWPSASNRFSISTTRTNSRPKATSTTMASAPMAAATDPMPAGYSVLRAARQLQRGTTT
jgi:hypothetical protein